MFKPFAVVLLVFSVFCDVDTPPCVFYFVLFFIVIILKFSVFVNKRLLTHQEQDCQKSVKE